METAVTRLETLFQKAESDLDYIQRRVEFEIMKSLPDDTAAEENPAALLKELPVLKSRYKSLCAQMEEISLEQKESMESIRAALEKTMKIVQALQQQTGLESLPLSEEELTAALKLNLQTGKEMEFSLDKPESTVPGSAEVPQFTPLTEETFMSVPRKIRSIVKLADLNYLYKELFNHFIVQNNREALSLSQMNKMNMKATDSRIKILKELGIVELDKQGNVKLAV
ncbi:spindle and kinetochore-associated protein 2 [Oenanthe melanoleuca]|uniref:spindle and kinetochore-associated protein 2 n=1 Tax=Oenanthe melanoleuca TaxID=2939378 RepID=UPI0024C1118D|nr:spindle and kinetochore-associated protein 2 [Oenanthe melanoleuca]